MSHARDVLAYQHELVVHGVGYEDETDLLTFGLAFVNDAGIWEDLCGFQSPCGMLELYAYEGEPEYVGVSIIGVTDLIDRYWNGHLKANCPVTFIADLLGVFITDPEVCSFIEDSAELALARKLHELARQIIEDVGSIPEEILERLRSNNLSRPVKVN